MRSFIVVPCLVATAIVLQGCGGGGSPTPAPGPSPVTHACVNAQIDVKSQSVTSTNKGTVTTKVANITTKEVIDGTSTVKMDMEQMSLYENSAHTVSMTTAGGPPGMEAIDMKVEQKIILDVAKKVVVEWTKVTNVTSGKVLLTNCTAKTIAAMPAVAEVVMMFKGFALPMLQKVATCSGNDGKYDHYDMKVDLTDVAIPGVKQVTDVNVHGMETILMDKDFVMHSTTGKLTVSAKMEGLGDITVDETTAMTATAAKAGGPTAADLDWSSWGKCTPLMLEDVSTLFQPTKPSEITNKFNNKAFFKNQLLASIQAVMKATETKKLIV